MPARGRAILIIQKFIVILQKDGRQRGIKTTKLHIEYFIC